MSTSNSLELQEDPYEEVIAEITAKMGLRRIGWIFTDLVADDLEKGTVKHFRGNVETHFLSGQVITWRMLFCVVSVFVMEMMTSMMTLVTIMEAMNEGTSNFDDDGIDNEKALDNKA